VPNFKFEAWPTEFRTVNQYFGANPQNYSQFGLPGHECLDIMAPEGLKVFDVAAPTGANPSIVPNADEPQTINRGKQKRPERRMAVRDVFNLPVGDA
jgi:hypothetical protein